MTEFNTELPKVMSILLSLLAFPLVLIALRNKLNQEFLLGFALIWYFSSILFGIVTVSQNYDRLKSLTKQNIELQKKCIGIGVKYTKIERPKTINYNQNDITVKQIEQLHNDIFNGNPY